ncbi:ATP-binding cassette domain-containing protein [Thiotrichales bacterium 19X7-9]|nr:ATP-binding cassette domain-containing protein [Thiotrichales bacterium 19X7-9]TNF70219.1 MAG: ATP-binding cassette domain-containing protein [Gammaproteobacteria bacterium]UTW42033.1 ATP-binding cassette domain-containing protein [bacterium SCSIO 12844]
MNETVIDCKNVVLGYANKKPLTNPFSFSITPGSWIGIIGDNGSGKSTFFKNILGDLTPRSGKLTVFNHPCGNKHNNRQIGYIPQSRHTDIPDHLTAFELLKATLNAYQFGIAYYSQKKINKIKQYIDLVGANDYAHATFKSLSGGQKKRIYLAQALINQPKLLLLDEPLADLDLQAKHNFIRCLQKVHAEIPITVLMITHEMNEMHQYLSDFIHFHNQNVILTPNYPFSKAFEDHCHHV